MALVGATGSGKSTVARLLLRFYEPQAGSITLDGAELHNLDLDDLRHNVSVVFEDTFLFSDSVRANIAFARPDAPMADVERAAELAGAAEFVAALPEGYEPYCLIMGSKKEKLIFWIGYTENFNNGLFEIL